MTRHPDAHADADADADDGSFVPLSAEQLVERRSFVADLVRTTRELVEGAALVEAHEIEDETTPVLAVEPVRSGAFGFWLVASHEMDVQIGDSAARWTVLWSAEGRSLVRLMIRSVVLGHGAEKHSPGRIDVELTLDDGTTTTEHARTSALGLVPIPGRERRARRRAFLPYR